MAARWWGVFGTISWLLSLPINLLLLLTIPDVRQADEQLFRKLKPLLFVMCIAWIWAISYVVTWMITIAGFDMGVPDSVMGLSFLVAWSLFQFACFQACEKGPWLSQRALSSTPVCLGLQWLARAVQTCLTNADFALNLSYEEITYTIIDPFWDFSSFGLLRLLGH